MRFPARMSLVPLIALLAMPSSLLAQSGEITFHKDIEPILQANCQIMPSTRWRRADATLHL